MKTMKTLKPVIVTTTILLLTLIACESGPSRAQQEYDAYERDRQQAFDKHMAFPKEPSADLKISAEGLARAWYVDSTRAKLLYEGKTLQVTGHMKNTGKFEEIDYGRGYRIILWSPYWDVHINFPRTAAEQLLYMETNGVMTPVIYHDQVERGYVTVVGRCWSGDIYDAYFVTE